MLTVCTRGGQLAHQVLVRPFNRLLVLDQSVTLLDHLVKLLAQGKGSLRLVASTPRENVLELGLGQERLTLRLEKVCLVAFTRSVGFC